jgi:hypothetical protein
MMVLMFVILAALFCGMGFMMYLMLCEQQATRLRLERIEAYVHEFERRQYLNRPIEQSHHELTFAELIGEPTIRMIREAA